MLGNYHCVYWAQYWAPRQSHNVHHLGVMCRITQDGGVLIVACQGWEAEAETQMYLSHILFFNAF